MVLGHQGASSAASSGQEASRPDMLMELERRQKALTRRMKRESYSALSRRQKADLAYRINPHMAQSGLLSMTVIHLSLTVIHVPAALPNIFFAKFPGRQAIVWTRLFLNLSR